MAIALIPARLGSKGIPNKNFAPLYHMSPLERAVSCCIGAGITPWVSSDAPNALKWPYWLDRPADLADDTTPMAAVVGDFLTRVPGEPDEIILLVQPTQPLREPKHLRAALELVEQYGSVMSVTQTESINKLYYQGRDSLIPFGVPVERRQMTRPTFRCDGTVYGFRRRDGYFHYRTATPLFIPAEETASLDTPLDWQLAELRLMAHYDETNGSARP